MSDDIKMNADNDNGNVKDQREKPSVCKRGAYVVLTPDEKLAIAKQAVEKGIHRTIADNTKFKLKYMSVRDWRDKYLQTKARTGSVISLLSIRVE